MGSSLSLPIEWDLVRVSPLLCQLKCTIERTVAVVAHCLQTYNLKQALKRPIAAAGGDREDHLTTTKWFYSMAAGQSVSQLLMKTMVHTAAVGWRWGLLYTNWSETAAGNKHTVALGTGAKVQEKIRPLSSNFGPLVAIFSVLTIFVEKVDAIQQQQMCWQVFSTKKAPSLHWCAKQQFKAVFYLL